MAANYLPTDGVGVTRRRAKFVGLNNPSGKNSPLSVTFSMEDRVTLADGTETNIDQGLMVVPITDEFLTREYPRLDVKTGAVVGKARTGAELLKIVMEAFSDVFIAEGLIREKSHESK